MQEVGVFAAYPDVAAFLTDVDDGTLEAALINAQDVFDSNNANNTWSLAETNVGQFSFYLQDEWHINERFKLTYGIRFDKPLYFNTDEKIQENIERKGTYIPDIDYFNPDTNELVRLDSNELPSSRILFSPRVGFNWDVRNDRTFQVRGGSGLFTGRFPFVWLGNQVQGVDFFFYQIVDPDFKWPQVWRTSLGVDYKLENGVILTGDLSFTQDINGTHVQNWGLGDPSGVLNTTFENRPVYNTNNDRASIFDEPTNAYVFTNSDKGRIWNVTLKGQKTFANGLYTSLAYNYLNAKDVNSIEAEITGDAFNFNPALGNVNDDILAFSRYGDTHRIIGIVSKQFKYGNDKWATTVSSFFEYAQGGRFSYTYGGDINNDGSQLNDLLYVPTSEEINQMVFSGTPAEQIEQAAAFEAFIQQDNYLSDRRGQYTERYGALAPWRGRWDIKILQDYTFKVSAKRTNTIQLSLDILNVGNLISSDWGLVQQPTNVQPIGVSLNPATYEPTYTFNTDLDETFVYNSSLLSRWQAQIGLRYIF